MILDRANYKNSKQKSCSPDTEVAGFELKLKRSQSEKFDRNIFLLSSHLGSSHFKK